jgi:hypothetical protein
VIAASNKEWERFVNRKLFPIRKIDILEAKTSAI